MRNVAVVGVGLIGGSFALALRKAGYGGRILGVSSAGAIREALARGIIDQAVSLEEAAERADLLYLSQPIQRILETLGRLAPLVRDGCLVTDAGSTKSAIVAAAAGMGRGQFLGGHPMAGKEVSGVAESEAGLFRGRTYVLTPRSPEELETPAARRFVQWVERIGAAPLVLAPEEHDRVVAYTSHLAQLASTALAVCLAGKLDLERHARAAGPGLMDMTRLALSPYSIWHDILHTNRAAIDAALEAYIAKLEELRRDLTSPEMERHFTTAAEFRGQATKPPNS